MPSLIELRKKTQGITNTSKITKAMQLVAASKMRFFQKKALSTRAYVADLINILHQHLKSDETLKNIYTEKREKGPTLFVIYTSDKGLCGPLNNQLLRSLFRSRKWLDTLEEDRILITIGRKSTEFARINKIKVFKHFKGIPEKLTTFEALPIIEAIIDLWTERKCKEVLFVAPHYKNTFTSYPVLKTYLPFSEAMFESNTVNFDPAPKKREKLNYMLYEPDKSRIITVLTEQMVEAIFIQSFFELKAAEYSSRMIAMQNATDAANKIIQHLKLTYNKTRQGLITQEIAELVGGSEAIS